MATQSSSKNECIWRSKYHGSFTGKLGVSRVNLGCHGPFTRFHAHVFFGVHQVPFFCDKFTLELSCWRRNRIKIHWMCKFAYRCSAICVWFPVIDRAYRLKQPFLSGLCDKPLQDGNVGLSPSPLPLCLRHGVQVAGGKGFGSAVQYFKTKLLSPHTLVQETHLVFLACTKAKATLILANSWSPLWSWLFETSLERP